MVATLAEVAVLAGPGPGGGGEGGDRRGRSGVSSSGGDRQWPSRGRVARGVSGMPPPPLLPSPPPLLLPPLPVPPPPLPLPQPPGCILGARRSRQPSSCALSVRMGERSAGHGGDSCSGRACVDLCVRPGERASPGALRLPRAEPRAEGGTERGGVRGRGSGEGGQGQPPACERAWLPGRCRHGCCAAPGAAPGRRTPALLATSPRRPLPAPELRDAGSGGLRVGFRG